MPDTRKPIDRTYYNTPEFHERLTKAIEQAANDPEYQAECRAWEVVQADGLINYDGKD